MIYEIYTENGTKKKRALTGNGYGLPLGTWISYEGTCPDGFIESEQTFNTTTYAALYALLGTNKVPARFDHSVLSDWEDVTISTDSTNQTVVSHDGFIHFEQSDNSNEVAEFKLYINDIQIVDIRASSYASRKAGQGVTLPVKKGDTVYTNNIVNHSKARYYKRHLAIKATPAYVEPDTVSDMVNTLRTQDSYSTSEVNTGKKWIDGKPIYRKCFYSATNWANETVIGTISNIDFVTLVNNISYNTQRAAYYANYDSTDGLCIASVEPSSGKVIVNRSSVFANTYPSAVTIEYTKTTD